MSNKTGWSTGAVAVLVVSLGLVAHVAADELALKGRLITPDGRITIKEFPVIVKGPEVTLVATTDKQGLFKVGSLPPGLYDVAPANEPDLVRSVMIEKSPVWWAFWKEKQPPIDLGDIYLEAGKKY